MLRLSKVVEAGEDIAETLEVIAAVEGQSDRAREVFVPAMREDNAAAGPLPRGAALTCRTEPAGDDLFEKFGQPQPLYRQCQRYARKGFHLSVPTLADQVGPVRRCCSRSIA